MAGVLVRGAAAPCVVNAAPAAPRLAPTLARCAALGFVAVFLLATACGKSAAPEPCGDPCVLSDDNNFAFASELDVTVQTMKEFSNVTITWGGLSRDLQGHPLDPLADIDEALLVVFRDLTPEDVTDLLSQDNVPQAEVDLYVVCEPVDAACSLSEFGLMGMYPEVDQHFGESTGSWLIALRNSAEVGTRAMLFLEPTATSDAEVAYVTDDSYHLEVDADLASLSPVGIPAGATVQVDWSGLTVDGFGNSMALHTLDELVVGRFDMTPAEMEDAFLDLDYLPAEQWVLDVSGTSHADLADLEGFSGIDEEGTWSLALRCNNCFHPAPRFITRLVVAP